MADKLANEIVAASKGEGAAFKRRKTHTAWLKPTKPSHILEFRILIF
jgi:hypothetical protein